MKQVIGFTNKYYTLWEVSDPYTYWISKENSVERTDYTYIKNLSMDFDSAKSKVVGKYDIDLDLRGAGSFHRDFRIDPVYGDDEFSFGMLKGEKIAESNDVWQITRTTSFSLL